MAPIRHPFICIEGIDGVGKSTTAKKLAETVNGIYFKTPSKPYSDVRDAIDQQADSLSRFYFYLSSVAFASREIEQLCARTPVVCDRHVYSTYAYHFALDASLRAKVLALSVFARTILVPDFTVLLTVEEQERQRRLRTRIAQTCSNEQLRENNSTFLASVEKEFLKMGLYAINATAIAVPEVVNQIVNRLGDFYVTASGKTTNLLGQNRYA